VRDVVKAYWLLLQKGQSGEAYNVCSQQAYSVKEIIDCLSCYADVNLQLKISPSLLRKTDIPIILGCLEKIMKATGWEPKISLNETLQNMLKYWSDRIM
jgi:GDP-4-dehydro-6-deoxy-D-mannose reductase